MSLTKALSRPVGGQCEGARTATGGDHAGTCDIGPFDNDTAADFGGDLDSYPLKNASP
ncbi:DUF4259 domain-containing protein [Streptomyces atratus]|uniref:DUF4259 domain-containing protein n=1 Tax=Streptomyces atratus TaxID=1893 RepID=UPI00166FEB1E